MEKDALMASFSIVVHCEGPVLPTPSASPFSSLLHTHKAIAVLRAADLELALCLATAVAAGVSD
jgi:hypothetical protein